MPSSCPSDLVDLADSIRSSLEARQDRLKGEGGRGGEVAIPAGRLGGGSKLWGPGTGSRDDRPRDRMSLASEGLLLGRRADWKGAWSVRRGAATMCQQRPCRETFIVMVIIIIIALFLLAPFAASLQLHAICRLVSLNPAPPPPPAAAPPSRLDVYPSSWYLDAMYHRKGMDVWTDGCMYACMHDVVGACPFRRAMILDELKGVSSGADFA